MPRPGKGPSTAFVTVLVLSGLFLGAVPTTASEDVVPAVAADNVEVLRFRTEFGLPTDAATLDAAEAASDRSSAIVYGIPLLPAEIADLRWREEVGSHIPPLGRVLERDHSSTFGGIFMDQAARGTVDVAFTADPEQHWSTVQAALPDGADIRLRQVKNTLQYLREVQSDLDARSNDIRSRGVVLLSTEVQIRTNRVEVGVSSAPDWFVRDTNDRYGTDVVSITVSTPPQTTTCTSRDSCTDTISGTTSALRAGTHLYDSGCTFAFGAIFDQSGTKGVLTAGHCADLVPAGHTYQHPNNTNMGNA